MSSMDFAGEPAFVRYCYVEAETRGRERMDLVIDYRGEQFVVELKVWRGNAYNERGEAIV